MHLFVEICGFIGGWLLVAGPIYQAALELKEEDFKFERIKEAATKIQPPSPISSWWWIFPPIKLYLERRRSKKFRRDYVKTLSSEDTEAIVSYINKATSWMFVAFGAFFIAIKETYELLHVLHWDDQLLWLVVPAMALLSIVNMVLRVKRSEKIIRAAR